ncbi:MAG TPA: 2-oxoacid:acceptor oxidoreductase subunit alpha, partial [Bacillota bacterium]
LLASFEEETLARHALAVVPGGALIYNADHADVPFDHITFLDAAVRERLTAYLSERGLPASTAGLLSDAQRRGVNVFAIPLGEIAAQLRAELGVSQAVADRMLNTVAVAVSCALLEYPAEYLRKALVKAFSEGSRLVTQNMHAVELAYSFVRDRLNTGGFSFRLAPVETTAERDGRIFVSGTQAVALGKLAAGVSFQTYYPISPATDESVYLEAHETFSTRDGGKGSVVVVQTEDELAAVTMAIGAALTGARSATATSGPGFSLMAEGLGWAGINEVPLVVTLYQRGGPSTGLPTRTEQGDLQFALRAGHGEFPRFVIASGDATEAFYDAAAAFNYADRYQTVVIHLLDKALASATQTLKPFDVDGVRIERGEIWQPGADDEAVTTGNRGFKRFAATPTGISPRPLLGTPGGMHWLTGGEHTQYGRVTEDPTERERQMEKRARKFELAAREIPIDEKLKVYGDREAAFTILSWGSNKGAILEALERLAADGIAARFVQVRLLSPFPAAELGELLANAKPLVIVECNFSGQFADLFREQLARPYDYLIVKYNGRPMAGGEVYRSLKDIYQGKSERRVVLRNPYE